MSRARRVCPETLVGFTDLWREEACELLPYGRWLELAPGAPIFAQDSPVPYLALIETGAVEVFVNCPTLRDQVRIVSLQQGDVIGWELLAGRARSAFEVRARRHCRLFILRPDSLDSLRESNPQAAVKLANAALQTAKAIEKASRALCDSGSLQPAEHSGPRP